MPAPTEKIIWWFALCPQFYKNLFWMDAAYVKFLGLHSYLLIQCLTILLFILFQRKASILAFPSQFLPNMHEDSHLDQKFAIKDAKERKIAVILEMEEASPIFYPLILPHKNLSLAQFRSGEVLFNPQRTILNSFQSIK